MRGRPAEKKGQYHDGTLVPLHWSIALLAGMINGRFVSILLLISSFIQQPLKGASPLLEANLETFFTQEYPGEVSASGSVEVTVSDSPRPKVLSIPYLFNQNPVTTEILTCLESQLAKLEADFGLVEKERTSQGSLTNRQGLAPLLYHLHVLIVLGPLSSFAPKFELHFCLESVNDPAHAIIGRLRKVRSSTLLLCHLIQ